MPPCARIIRTTADVCCFMFDNQACRASARHDERLFRRYIFLSSR